MTGPVQTVPTTTVSRPSTLSKTTTRTPTRPAHTALSSAAHSLTVSAVSIQPTSSIGTRPSSSKTGTISDESAVAHADDSSNGGKSVSVTGGVVGGLMGVLLVGAAIWFLLFRRLRRGSLHSALGRHGIGSSGGSGVQQCRPLHPSPKRSSPASFTSSFGSSVHKPLSISPPRLQSDTAAYRTDFIRKLPSSHESSEPASSACSTVGTADVSHLRAASTVSSLSCSQNSQCEFSPQPSLLPQPLFVTRPSPQKHGSVLVKPIRDMRNSTSRPQHPPRETDVLGTNVVSKMSSSPKAGGPLGASASSENSSGHAKLNEAHDGDSARMTTFTKLLQAAAMEPVIPAASQRAVPASAPPRR
ncbi:hypothetical protein SEPCBS119000_001020 [Sporothrix epigloea]|uniref:Uncharacterized protein n=1 Tax=Sporothrix epigloea TaxID=1892477 RepID=A0ABP0D8F7_9PEZI